MSIVKMDDNGLTYCSCCSAVIECDEYGDMPDACPQCGAVLDWSEFDASQEGA